MKQLERGERLSLALFPPSAIAEYSCFWMTSTSTER